MNGEYDGLIKPEEAETITIDDLFVLKLITAREYNELHRRNILNVLQIIVYNKDELRKNLFISDAGFDKIVSAVHSLGLLFKDEVETLSYITGEILNEIPNEIPNGIPKNGDNSKTI